MPSETAGIEVLSQGRAAVYEEPIGPAGGRVRELPRTEPKPGHVAVAIRNASINHLDLWLAHGAQRVTPPRVIAADGAGVVHASGDPAWKPGGEVGLFPTLCCGGGGPARTSSAGVLASGESTQTARHASSSTWMHATCSQSPPASPGKRLPPFPLLSSRLGGCSRRGRSCGPTRRSLSSAPVPAWP